MTPEGPDGMGKLRRLQAESQRGFFRALGSGSPGAKLLEPGDGVLAAIVPVRPWFSIFNTVLYLRPEDLADTYPELLGRYEEAGVHAWTVWVPPGDESAPELLEGRGHTLDSTPMLMAAEIDAVDLESRLELNLEPEPSWETIARCNDQAHGILEQWSMAAVFATMDDPASRLWAACVDGQPASVLVARELDGDCYFWFVATAPEAQRRGLASELMRRALRDASARGCTTTTLESTKIAEPMYEELGYQALGRYQMWELRKA